MSDFPQRGEVWIINWNPGRGSEQAGKRPALIIQNDIGNARASTTIVAAVSSRVKLYPINVPIQPPEGGLLKPSVVSASQILTVSKLRLVKRIGVVKPETMRAVERAIQLSLSIE